MFALALASISHVPVKWCLFNGSHESELSCSGCCHGNEFELVWVKWCNTSPCWLKTYLNLLIVLISAAKYYFYDNYFDLPGALLCARVVDMLNKVGTGTRLVVFCHLHAESVYSACLHLFFHSTERKGSYTRLLEGHGGRHRSQLQHVCVQRYHFISLTFRWRGDKLWIH